MSDFTEAQIQDMLTQLRDEFGDDPKIVTRELALLELEDMKRKGCTCETTACPLCSKMENCQLLDWEKRHPEYKNDELAMKIKILKAGGEEAYKAKLKAQEEAKKKAEDESS